MKKPIIGDKGLKERYELPENHIGVHKFIVSIIFVSLIAGFVLIAIFIRQKQDESFKHFVGNHKAGVYQGVTMSPLAYCGNCHKSDNKHDFKEGWLISGASDEGFKKTWKK